jgi:hypothetical protein
MICPVWYRVSVNNQFDLVRPFIGTCKPSVKINDKVEAESVVAHCEVSAGQRLVKVANILGVSRHTVKKYLLRSIGDRIYQGEIIARKKGVLGVGKSELKSPVDGVITDVDKNGDLIVKFLPMPVRLVAGASGLISNIREDSVTVRTFGTEITGAAGLGKSREGIIKIIGKPNEFILPQKIDASCQGRILVGGAHLDRAAIEKALTIGVKGIVVGGIDYRDFISLGVTSDVGITIIVTEGFGTVTMGTDIFEAFNKLNDKFAFINGMERTVLVPEDKKVVDNKPLAIDYWRELKIGDLVRYFRPDSTELVGVVEGLADDEIELNSGLSTKMAQIKFISGNKVSAPAANLEIIS